MLFDLSFIKGKKLLLLVNPFSPLEIFIINHSKYDSQSVKENRNVIPLIKLKPLVDTGVKISLGMQFIIQTHVCAKNSTNVWVLLIVENIRSLCGKQLCHYVYIYTHNLLRLRECKNKAGESFCILLWCKNLQIQSVIFLLIHTACIHKPNNGIYPVWWQNDSGSSFPHTWTTYKIVILVNFLPFYFNANRNFMPILIFPIALHSICSFIWQNSIILY